MGKYEKKDWFQLYQEAVLELEHVKMMGRIRDARAGITARVQALASLPGLHQDENHAMQEALSVLKTLEWEEERFNEKERKRLAAEALRKIEPLGTKIEKLNGGERWNT